MDDNDAIYSKSSITVVAGDGSAIWHTLFNDFVRVAQKLEKLGFKYCNGKVAILEVGG
jgi:hypothetical protein